MIPSRIYLGDPIQGARHRNGDARSHSPHASDSLIGRRVEHSHRPTLHILIHDGRAHRPTMLNAQWSMQPSKECVHTHIKCPNAHWPTKEPVHRDGAQHGISIRYPLMTCLLTYGCALHQARCICPITRASTSQHIACSPRSHTHDT